ncbi:MAG: T9SS type A sorting domain-containing protein [Balneolaceae bacterium]
MKSINTFLFLIFFSITAFGQSQPFEEEPKKATNLFPVHVSDRINDLDFLKSLTPLKDQINTRKVVTDNVGDKKNFWVSNSETGSFDSKQFELIKKGSATQIWFEVNEMNNGHLTTAVADSMFKYLEEKSNSFSYNPQLGIINLSNQIIGSPPNVDGDGVVDFLITDIKDGWTPEGNSGYTAGFFYGVDQYSSVELPVGYKSNERDVLYIDSYPGIYNGEEIDPLRPLGTLAHEYQHLIHFNYNDRINQSDYTFINEGQSNFTALLAGYFPSYSIGDYLQDSNVPIFRWERNGSPLPDYGRAASFFSYLWDQLGFENSGTLTQSALNGANGINGVLTELNSGLTFNDILVNWGLANLLNDRVNTGNTQYGYHHPFLSGLKTSDIENIGSSFSNKVVQIERGGIVYLGLGQASDLDVTVSWPGILGRARLITYKGSEKIVSELINGQSFSTPVGIEYDNAQIMLVNTAVGPDEASTTSPLSFTVSSAGEQTFALKSDSTYSVTPKFYWSLPYYNASQVGRLGFSNKYTAPLNSIIYSLELFIVSGVDANDQPIEVKGSGNLNISIREDNSGQPGSELASTSVPFSSLGTGWQTFNVKDWNLAVTNGQKFHVLYEFNVSTVNPDINSVPLRLDDGTGTQNVSYILTEPNTYAVMFADDESGGQHGVWNKVIYGQALVTSNEDEITNIPQQFVLKQNYPNPFNPSTNIQFSLPEASVVSLTIFNALGQEVDKLIDSNLNAGTHSITWDASNSPSGIYFYRLQADNFAQINKMLLIK